MVSGLRLRADAGRGVEQSFKIRRGAGQSVLFFRMANRLVSSSEVPMQSRLLELRRVRPG